MGRFTEPSPAPCRAAAPRTGAAAPSAASSNRARSPRVLRAPRTVVSRCRGASEAGTSEAGTSGADASEIDASEIDACEANACGADISETVDLGASAEVPGPFLVDPSYRIQVVEASEEVSCAVCGALFIAAGPTGFQDDRPLCDLCMLHREGQLGMVLALVAVTRSYGGASPSSLSEEVADKAELMAFARIYETFASSFAPARPVNPDSLWPLRGPLEPGDGSSGSGCSC